MLGVTAEAVPGSASALLLTQLLAPFACCRLVVQVILGQVSLEYARSEGIVPGDILVVALSSAHVSDSGYAALPWVDGVPPRLCCFVSQLDSTAIAAPNCSRCSLFLARHNCFDTCGWQQRAPGGGRSILWAL